MIGMYVNGNTHWVVVFKRTIRQRFKIKALGEVTELLGMHITRDRAAMTVSIDRARYIIDVLDKHVMGECSPPTLPMDPCLMSGIESTTLSFGIGHARDAHPNLLGNLSSAVMYSCPDISIALNIFGFA
jgi:hypothetical protein